MLQVTMQEFAAAFGEAFKAAGGEIIKQQPVAEAKAKAPKKSVVASVSLDDYAATYGDAAAAELVDNAAPLFFQGNAKIETAANGRLRCTEHKIFASAEGVCKRCEHSPILTESGLAGLMGVNMPKAGKKSKAARNASRVQRVEVGNDLTRRSEVLVAVEANGSICAKQADGRIAGLLDALGLPVSTNTTFGEITRQIGAYNKVARTNGMTVIFVQAISPKGAPYSRTESKALAALR